MASTSIKQEHEPQYRVADVVFDMDSLTLVGRYFDELSAHRAKKCWLKTLQDCFLLDLDTDLKLKVKIDSELQQFLLICEFNSSCARYAFWRLTNNHVPEAAYLLETAHIPESVNQNYMEGADLRAAVAREIEKIESRVEDQKGLLKKIGEMTKSLVKSL